MSTRLERSFEKSGLVDPGDIIAKFLDRQESETQKMANEIARVVRAIRQLELDPETADLNSDLISQAKEKIGPSFDEIAEGQQISDEAVGGTKE